MLGPGFATCQATYFIMFLFLYRLKFNLVHLFVVKLVFNILSFIILITRFIKMS